MTKQKLITMKIDSVLWEKFGDLLDTLKKAGFLDSHESRSSVIKDFIAMFLVVEEARLKEFSKDLKYYKKEENGLEGT